MIKSMKAFSVLLVIGTVFTLPMGLQASNNLVSCEAEIRGFDQNNEFTTRTQALVLVYQDKDTQNFEATFEGQSFSVSFRAKTQEITLRLIETQNPQKGLSSLGGFDTSGVARLALVNGSQTYRLTCQRH